MSEDFVERVVKAARAAKPKDMRECADDAHFEESFQASLGNFSKVIGDLDEMINEAVRHEMAALFRVPIGTALEIELVVEEKCDEHAPHHLYREAFAGGVRDCLYGGSFFCLFTYGPGAREAHDAGWACVSDDDIKRVRNAGGMK